MCYDVAYLTKRLKRYKEHYSKTTGFEEIVKKTPPTYHVSGFQHPELPAITSNNPTKVEMLTWGLIPPWIKNTDEAVKISNNTINARGEEMFDKPSFRESAEHQRCLIILDGFYEHYWKGGHSYPHFIQFKSEIPLTVAGLWSSWQIGDIVRNTCSIVTCEANSFMSNIHNKPRKSEGPRMPLILENENQQLWLNNELDQQEVLQLVKPLEDGKLKSHTTKKLRGKSYLGNVSETMKAHRYPELESTQGSLF